MEREKCSGEKRKNNMEKKFPKRILITGANSYIGVSFEKWMEKNPECYKIDTLDMLTRIGIIQIFLNMMLFIMLRE